MSDARRDEITKLETLYAQNPQGRIFTHLAEAYRKAGELDRAREVLAEGIERHPDYSSAHVVLGRVLRDQGLHDEAGDEFRRVLELDGQNLVALRSLGDIARAQGRDDDALDYYRRLVDLEPSDSEVREVIDVMTGALPAADEVAAGEAPVSSDEEHEPWPLATEEELEAPGAIAPAGEVGVGMEKVAEEDIAEEMAFEETVVAEEGNEPPAAAAETGEESADEELFGDEPFDEEPFDDEPFDDEPFDDEAFDEEALDEEPFDDEAFDDELLTAEPSAEEAEEPYVGERYGEPYEDEAEDQQVEVEGWAEAGDLEDQWSSEGGEDYGYAPGVDDGVVEAGGYEDGSEVDEGPDQGEDEDADVMTETIAQVYARQGLFDRAVEVYQELIRTRPDDEGLRERLAEIEALAAEADEGMGEVEAAESAEADFAPDYGIEPASEDESEDGDDEWIAPWAEAVDEAGLDEAEDEGAVLDLEPGEQDLEGAGPDWSEEARPEGFEAAEVETTPSEDVMPLEGLEAQEIEPETGLVVTPDDADQLADEEAGDREEAVTEEPAPWEAPEAAVEEVFAEVEEVGAGEAGDVSEAESPWMGEDYSLEETETPYAWAAEEEAEDTTPPIQDYLSGLLTWDAGGKTDDGVGAADTTVGPETEPGAERQDGEPERGAVGEEPSPSAGTDDDDDLEMFRSWLESLKE